MHELRDVITSYSIHYTKLYDEGVERIFPLYSPNLDKIEVTRIGKVRRAKLYYQRDRSGRSARIADDIEATKKQAEAAKQAKA